MQSKESMAGCGKGVLELKTPSRSPASPSNKPALCTSLWSAIAESNVCKHGLRANTMVDFSTWQLSPWMILLPVLGGSMRCILMATTNSFPLPFGQSLKSLIKLQRLYKFSHPPLLVFFLLQLYQTSLNSRSTPGSLFLIEAFINSIFPSRTPCPDDIPTSA